MFRADVHILNVGLIGGNELSLLPRGVALIDDVTSFIDLDVRLADDVTVLFPRGQIERPRLVVGLFAAADTFVGVINSLLRHVLARLEFCVASVVNPYILNNAAVLDLAIGRFDKAEFVDPRKARQRRDKADIRAFRRLDRADAAVVRRMNVADLKSRTLTRQTARPESREATLMSDLRQRVCLVHKLRKLG